MKLLKLIKDPRYKKAPEDYKKFIISDWHNSMKRDRRWSLNVDEEIRKDIFKYTDFKMPKEEAITAIKPTPYKAIEIPEKEVYEKRIETFAEGLMKDVYGKEKLKELKRGEKITRNLIVRTPMAAIAFASPFIALGFEVLQQAKNVIVPLIKKEKYDPFEIRLLTELLPERTPTPLKITANIGEAVGDIALIAGLANLATRGLLKETLKEIGTKLERAGYGKEKITIPKSAIKQAAKGTRLETVAKSYLKAKKLKIPTKYPKFPKPSAIKPPVSPIAKPTITPTEALIPAKTRIARMQNALKAPGITPEETAVITSELAKVRAEVVKPIPPKALPELTTEEKAEVLRKIIPDKVPYMTRPEIKAEYERLIVKKVPKVPAVKPKYLGEELKDKAGFVKIESILEPIKKSFHLLHDWLWTFGKLKRIDPTLYNKFMGSYYKLVGRINESIINVNKLLPKKRLTLAERNKLTYGVEEETYKVPKYLQKEKEVFSKFYKDLENTLKEAEIFKSGFVESKIAYNTEQVTIFRNKIDFEKSTKNREFLINKWNKKLDKFNKELEQLKVLNYLPHKRVVRAIVENKLAKMSDEQRTKFYGNVRRLSYRYRHRKGVVPLKIYIEEGLLKPEDVDIVKLSMETASEAKYRLIMKDLFDYGKKNKYIIHKRTKDVPKIWNTLNPLRHGIVAPEYNNYKIHPLYEAGLMELKKMLTTSRNPLKAFFSLVKVGQFYKPKIIWKYDFIQQALGGALGIKTPYYLAKSTTDALFKTPFFLKADKAGVFARPYLPGLNSRGERRQLEIAARWTLRDLPWFPKFMERLTGVPFKRENVLEYLISPYKAIWNLTWAGDEVIRLSSFRQYLAMGYPEEEAAKFASNWHGAYSEISPKAREQMSWFFFVYSFRFLMPRQLWRLTYEPIKMSYETLLGRKYPTRDWIRIAKGLTAAVLLPMLYHWHLRRRGFKAEVPLWKYYKEVDGSDVVAGINTIINMPIKWAARLLKYNPVSQEPRIIQGTKAWGKWEMHPVYRILLDIRDNRQSIGYGQVYNPSLEGPQKAAQITGYFIKESFRILETMIPKETEEERGYSLWSLTKKEQQELIDQTMTDFDKLLVNTLGYIYVRPDKDYWYGVNLKNLEREFRRRMMKAKTKEEEELVDRWFDRVDKILRKRYSQ